MAEPRRVALFGLFGVGNIGNEASLTAGLQAVARHGLEVVVIGAHPNVVADQHHVPAVAISMAGPLESVSRAPRPVRLALRPVVELARWFVDLRFARTVDAFVVPGTGILDDFGVRPHEMPYDLARWSTVARLARRPWIMVGVGAGPIQSPWSRRLMRRTVRNASLVTYRDEDARAFMVSIGVPSPADVVQPDLAFGLDRPIVTGESHCIGLGLMAYYGWANDWEAGRTTMNSYVASMVEIARRILAGGHSIRVLVGEASDQAAVDLFVGALRPEVGDAWHRRVTIDPIADFDDLLAQAAQTDAIVATRYHNVVAGLMVARPVIAIGYAEKFRQVMGEFGLAAYCHDVVAIDVDAVVADLRSVLAGSDEIVARLSAHNERMELAVEAGFSAAFAAVGAGGRDSRHDAA